MLKIHGKNVEITKSMRQEVEVNVQDNLVNKYTGVDFQSGNVTVESVSGGHKVSTYLKTHIGEVKLTKTLGRMVRDRETRIIQKRRENSGPDFMELDRSEQLDLIREEMGLERKGEYKY